MKLLIIYLALAVIFIPQRYLSIEIGGIKPHEVALLQFDSRPLGDYWLAAALWNQEYALSHVRSCWVISFNLPDLLGQTHYRRGTNSSTTTLRVLRRRVATEVQNLRAHGAKSGR